MAATEHQPLPSMMADLERRRATGSLVVTSDGAVREILFTNGEIRAARSQLEQEKLGMWLVSRGKISEDDRALILLAQGGGGSPPLGHILVTKEFISQENLERELEELALTIVRRAAASVRPSCEFVDGGGEGQLDTLPNVDTPQIILLAAREFSDVDSIRLAIGSLDQSVRLSGTFKDLLDEIELTPTEGFLVSRLEGSPDLASLIRLSSLPEDQTYSTLYALVMSGTVVLGDGKGRTEDVPETTSPLDDTPPVILDEPSPTAGRDVEEQAEFSERQLEERRYIRKLSEAVTRVDHYRALGLRTDANPNEIKEAWKNIRERYDPEKRLPHLSDMAAHMERIVERGRAAYEVLSAYSARERYDAILDGMEQARAKVETRSRGEMQADARKELVEANFKRANELIKEDELYLAIQLLERACALDPRPDELIKLSRLLQRNPLWVNRALGCMRRAIEADPRHVPSWLELADFWRRRNHSERQRKSLERVLSIDPDNEQANRMYKELVGSRELQRLLRRARQMR